MFDKRTRQFLDKNLPRGYGPLVLALLDRPCNIKQVYMVRNEQRHTEDIALALVAVAKAEKARKAKFHAKLQIA